MAVDCGGNGVLDAGDTLANALELLGIRELNALVLTHYNEDHINGVETLLERINVKRVYGPKPLEDTKEFAALREVLDGNGTEWRQLTEDSTFAMGVAEMPLFAPLDHSAANESGLSVYTKTEEFDVLVMGDMNQKAERQLLYQKHLPELDVLVTGHHGSNSSTGTELLEELQPETAVISVGENPYGHPSQEMLDRLKAANVTVYRTDLNGTVTIKEG